MIRCIAIDDEPLALRQMVSYIEKTPSLELIEACDNALDAIKVLEKEEVDLLFVDINMPDLSGIDFVKTIKRENYKIIFTTAYSEYAIEGFKVDALDYLLKPIGYADFLKAVQKAKEWFDLKHQAPDKNDKNFLFVKSGYSTVKVNLKNITYIEGMREYVRIHFTSEKPVMTLLSMKALEDQLPTSDFMRVHRSYIVNLNQVTTIERNRIVFDGKTYIPVGEQYKEAFLKFINSNFL